MEKIPSDIFNLTLENSKKYFRENEKFYDELSEDVKEDISTLLNILRYSNIVIENGVQIVDKYDIEKRKMAIDKYHIEEYEKTNS